MNSEQQKLRELLDKATLCLRFDYKIDQRRDEHFCELRYFNRPTQVVIFTELRHSGMSVTNAIELIIPQAKECLKEEHDIVLRDDCLFLEHYNEASYVEEQEALVDTLTKVDLTNSEHWWSDISIEKVIKAISLPEGLIVFCLRNAYTKFGDTTNNGVSSRFAEFLLVGEGVPEVFAIPNPEQILELKKVTINDEIRYYAQPYLLKTHTMSGGNFCYSVDGRFDEATAGYPISIHDRVEG